MPFSVFKPSRHVTSVHTTKPTVHYKNQLLFGGFEPANETETEWSGVIDLILLQGTGGPSGSGTVMQVRFGRRQSVAGGEEPKAQADLASSSLAGSGETTEVRLPSRSPPTPFPPSAARSGALLTLTPSRAVLTKAPEPAPAASTSLGRAQTETYAKYDADAQVDNNAAAEKRRFAGVSRRKSISYEREEHEKTSAEEQRREKNRKKFEETELVDDVSSVPLPSLVRGWPKANAFLDPKRRSWRYPS